jgi:hypothetical protein
LKARVSPPHYIYGPDVPIVEIHPAGECEPLRTPVTAVRPDSANHPVIAPGIVIDVNRFEVDVIVAVTPDSVLHRAPASFYGPSCITSSAAAQTPAFDFGRPHAPIIKID